MEAKLHLPALPCAGWRTTLNLTPTLTVGLSLSLSCCPSVLHVMRCHQFSNQQHVDAIILGASKMHHLEENMAGALGGSLDPQVVAAFDSAWELARPTCPVYFR